MRRLILIIGAGLLAAIVWSAVWLSGVWQQSLQVPESGATVEVVQGESLRGVLKKIEGYGWLRNALWVGRIASWRGLDQRISAGEFSLLASMDAGDLIEHLSSGRVIQYRITIPEGVTLSEAISILSAHPKLAHPTDDTLEKQLIDWVAPARSAEGWFLPETWVFTAGDDLLDILQRSHTAMRELLAELWETRQQDLPLATPYEALILASIVERETGKPDERSQIAGVFLRRLERGMRLQTDPTVIYGLADQYDGNLKRRHLRDTSNPYNTYAIKGLPPTPIALPGKEALRAVFEPDESDHLYFVAKGDGAHAFSSTLEQHEQNVRKYQLNRRKDYRSAPLTGDATHQ